MTGPVEMETVRYGARKVIHLAGMVFPIAYLAIPSSREMILSITLPLSTASLFFDEVRMFVPVVNSWFVRNYGPYLKGGERQGFTGLTFFLFASALTIIFFNRGVAVAALFCLCLGDPAAAEVRRRLSSTGAKLRSLTGAGACFLVSLAAGAVLLSPPQALAGAAGATVAEHLSRLIRIDDNLTIPLMAGLAISLTAGG